MNILIIGAARGVGRQLAEQALAGGHRVTGLVQNPLGAGLSRRNLPLVGGSIWIATLLRPPMVRGKGLQIHAEPI